MSTEKILFEGIEEFQEVAFELSYHLTANPGIARRRIRIFQENSRDFK